MSRVDTNKLRGRRNRDRTHGKYADYQPPRKYPKLPWRLVLNGTVLMSGETREELAEFQARYRIGGEIVCET